MSTLLLLQKIHGHVALLGIALALHPVFALRPGLRPTRRVRLAGYLAAAFTVGSNALGWLVYPAYREEVKRVLYAGSRWWGELFEIKEHLAFYALCLSLAGAAQLYAARGDQGPRLRRSIRATWLLVALLSLASGVLGIYLSSVRGFAYGLQ